MNPLNVFADLTATGALLGFYTIQNRQDIPAVPGCYGWFLPFWLIRDTLPEFLSALGTVLSHEPNSPTEMDAGFKWDSVKVRVRRSFEPPPSSFAEPLWDRLHRDDQAKDALQQVLLQASILTPPLYVGKADNLKDRYTKHTTRDGTKFNTRFSKFSGCQKLGIQVEDLIFICVSTTHVDHALKATAGPHKPNELVEEILKRLCRPPFSLQ